MQATLENLADALHRACAELTKHNARQRLAGDHLTDDEWLAQWRWLADSARCSAGRATSPGNEPTPPPLVASGAANQRWPLPTGASASFKDAKDGHGESGAPHIWKVGDLAMWVGSTLPRSWTLETQRVRSGLPGDPMDFEVTVEKVDGDRVYLVRTAAGLTLDPSFCPSILKPIVLPTDALLSEAAPKERRDRSTLASGLPVSYIDLQRAKQTPDLDVIRGRLAMLEVQHEEMRRWSTEAARMLSELRAPPGVAQSTTTPVSVAQQMLDLAAIRARCRDVDGATAAVQAYLALAVKP